MSGRLIIEADGGSRGNPGPAGYGAVVKDALTGEVLAEESESLGQATNNYAEYSGLIAGLRAAARLAPGADVEVRMDSKLVVEQMSGRWQIKHPGLRPLARDAAAAARGLGRVRYTWVPRERNIHADRLANQAMDAADRGRSGARRSRAAGPARGAPGSGAGASGQEPPPARLPGGSPPRGGSGAAGGSRSGGKPADRPGGAWRPPGPGWTQFAGPPVTTVLLRHGETPMSAERRFAGRTDIPLTAAGVNQARAAARRLSERGLDLIVASPLRRAQVTAAAVAEVTGAPVVTGPAWRETDFGEWEGLSLAEVAGGWPAEAGAWSADQAVAPPGGESFADVGGRVLPALAGLLAGRAGQTVLIVSHVTPMKIVLRHALLAPPEAMRRMHLDVACLCEIDWYTQPAPPGPGHAGQGHAGGGAAAGGHSGTGDADPGPAGFAAVVRSLNDTGHLHAAEWNRSALC